MTWKTTFLFMVLATLVVILVGWLTSIGILPISQMINYSDAGLRFIRVWILLAIAIGLIVPTITFVIWFKYPEIRKIFGLYLLVLIIQIVTEQIVSEFGAKSSGNYWYTLHCISSLATLARAAIHQKY
ncbi:hypothetical protein [Nostoc sp. 'Peltigera malacea cyanobiont' DB3992]|uniref:hypothetical protein n=1 Tax=Nostoc sp. 'Peltigera malacea cyanobiont' DB3992 TaxID=1206980 RepID=UPI00211F2EEB|nr:hypothetical protein [Nostoc sp. 'Peltigera malacea cyanobiont' DB3992]